MRLFCCVILLASPFNIFAFCNLKNCYNISSSELGSVGFELGALGSFDLKTVNTVVLNGLVEENCSLSLKCTSNKENDATNFRMEFVKMQAKLLLTHTPYEDVKPLTLVNSTITDLTSSYDAVVTIGIQFRLEDTVFAYYYTDDYERRESNYESLSVSDSDTRYKKPSTRLLKGKDYDDLSEEIYRNLSATGCGDKLTLSLCPCSEPVITELEWNNETSVLNCSAVSIEGNENIAITWTENDTFIHLNRTKTFSSGHLMKTSMLLNVTSTEELKDYTCTVTLGSGSDTLNVTRIKRIPALAPEEDPTHGKEEKPTDDNKEYEEDKGVEEEVKKEDDEIHEKGIGSKDLIIIAAVVSGLLVIIVVLNCVGVIKLVRHFSQQNSRSPEDEGVELEPVYDRLDPELMAINRGNRSGETGAVSRMTPPTFRTTNVPNAIYHVPEEELYVEMNLVNECYVEMNPVTESYVEMNPVTECYVEMNPVTESYVEMNPADECYVEMNPVTESYDEKDPVNESYVEMNPVNESYVEKSPVNESYV